VDGVTTEREKQVDRTRVVLVLLLLGGWCGVLLLCVVCYQSVVKRNRFGSFQIFVRRSFTKMFVAHFFRRKFKSEREMSFVFDSFD
jgi:hypothetical protein